MLELGAEARIVLEPVSWPLYEQLLTEVGDSRAVRFAYDGGRLEIMSPSRAHQAVKKTVARLVEAFADSNDIDIDGLGSWTMNRADVKKGIEPDDCYYVQSFPAATQRRGLDLAADPPPDLAIDVDIAHSLLPKLPIYAALGVPEVWRFDGKCLKIFRRNNARGYAESLGSACFPTLPIDALNRFVQIGLESHQPAALRALREWMKDRSSMR